MKELTIQQLESGYGNRIMTVKDISFTSKPGKATVIMGPSGSGKTTLLLTILGILQTQKGEVTLGEREITHEPIETRNIGYLPQDYGLFPHLNVIENVSYGLRMRGIGKEKRHKAAMDMLSLVELQEHAEKRIGQLSGGQKQRVSLARALAIKPDLLLLDEPLSNVDQATKWEVAKGLLALFAKLDIPILLVTHNAEDAQYFAKHLIILIEGRVAQEGTFSDVQKSPKTEFIKRLLMPFSAYL